MPYRSRLNNIPSLSSAPATVPAARYNRVRLALRRLENPLRIELPGLRSLDMILEDEVWAIVDRDLNDIPIVAWTGFESRSALHTPLRCTLHYYHAHASAILDTALNTLDRILGQRLARHG